MAAAIDKGSPGMPAKLANEGPLAEKDEQGLAAQRMQKLAQAALKKWRRLKEKIIKPFKK